MLQRLIEHIRDIVPDLEQAEQRIDADLEKLEVRLQYQVRGAKRVIVPTGDYPQDLIRRELLTSAREGLAKLRRGWSLDESDIEGLEALVDETLPFLAVKESEFDLPDNWSWLKPQYMQMRATLPSVGRIGPSRDGTNNYWGTGFLVADDIVMTNWHVVNGKVFEHNGIWKFYPHIDAQTDFLVEYQTEGKDQHQCVEVYKHPDYDLALIRIDAKNELPGPLTITSSPPLDLQGRPVYVAGHPYKDTRTGANKYAQMRLFLMWNMLGFKHVALGYTHSLLSYQPDAELDYSEMPHLCHLVSTLPGNSGSCVIDAETHQVIGLHCAGDNIQKRNYAVPLWELVNDPMLLAANVNFH